MGLKYDPQLEADLAERDQRIAELEKALQNTRENWGETSFRYSNCQADLARVTKERDEARATKNMHKERQEEEIGLRLCAEKALAEAKAEAARIVGLEEELSQARKGKWATEEELSRAKAAIREVLERHCFSGSFEKRLRAIAGEEPKP